ARVHQPDLLHAGYVRDEQLGELGLGLGGSAKAAAAAGLGPDRVDHGGVGVPQDQGTVSRDQVEVAAAVRIDQVGTQARRREDRFTPNRLERPDGAVHTPGDDPPRPIEPVAQLGEGEGAGLPWGEAAALGEGEAAPGAAETAGLGVEGGAGALSTAIQK